METNRQDYEEPQLVELGTLARLTEGEAGAPVDLTAVGSS